MACVPTGDEEAPAEAGELKSGLECTKIVPEDYRFMNHTHVLPYEPAGMKMSILATYGCQFVALFACVVLVR